MNDHTARILCEYIEGDQTQRLHLFLTYRDLRPQFMDLEKRDSPLHYPVASMSFKSTGVCRRLFTRMAGAFSSFISL